MVLEARGGAWSLPTGGPAWLAYDFCLPDAADGTGWSRQRRVVLLRRKFNRPLALLDRTDPGQPLLGFAEVLSGKREVWEYAALVTSLDSEILTLGQLYRDRADCENAFDLTS